MFTLYDFDQLPLFKGSEQIIEKVEEASGFARDKGFAVSKPSYVEIDFGKATTAIHLSHSLPLLKAFKKGHIVPSFKIEELALLKGSEPLIGKIEDVLAFIRRKGYYAKTSAYGLDLNGKPAAANFSITVSFRLPFLKSFASARISSLQKPYKPKIKSFLDSFHSAISQG